MLLKGLFFAFCLSIFCVLRGKLHQGGFIKKCQSRYQIRFGFLNYSFNISLFRQIFRAEKVNAAAYVTKSCITLIIDKLNNEFSNIRRIENDWDDLIGLVIVYLNENFVDSSTLDKAFCGVFRIKILPFTPIQRVHKNLHSQPYPYEKINLAKMLLKI